MKTQNIKKQMMIRLINFSLLLVCIGSTAALAQVAITIAPESKAELREKIKAEMINPRVKLDMINPRVKLEALASRGRISTTRLQPQSGDAGDAVQRNAGNRNAASEAAVSPLVYGKEEAPFGVSYGELSSNWWQWATSIPKVSNPVSDTTGAFAFAGQHGKIWFLAGNGGGVDERTITLPANTPLFIPVLNALFFDDGTTGAIAEDEIRTLLTDFNANPTLELTVDYQPLPGEAIYHVQSDLFTTAFPEHHLFEEFDVPQGIYDISFADTYFVMLKPLAPGAHVIKIKGATSEFSTYVEYYINVAAPSGALIPATEAISNKVDRR